MDVNIVNATELYTGKMIKMVNFYVMCNLSQLKNFQKYKMYDEEDMGYILEKLMTEEKDA